jgi:hypothetical protein
LPQAKKESSFGEPFDWAAVFADKSRFVADYCLQAQEPSSD